MFVFCECCVCCQIDVFAKGRSLAQKSPTDCGESINERDYENLNVKKPRAAIGLELRKMYL